MDPRRRRTRDAVVSAFARLAAQRRYGDITTGDLVAAAGIGRSTFYEHFRGKDDLLLAAMEPILLTLANAVAGRASRAQVRTTLKHLWDGDRWGASSSARAPRLSFSDVSRR